MIRSYVNEVIETYKLIYPIDLYNFVSMLGFNVKHVDTGNSDAYTIINGGEKLILLNKNINLKKRINFTLAHELGHYFIPHHLEPLYACSINEIISTKNLSNLDIENEADIFASELLMPYKLFAGCNARTFDDILNVSMTYNVSIQAAAIKLIEYTQDVVCFICCNDRKIKWYAASENFKQYLTLKDIYRSPVPELSLLDDCIKKDVSKYIRGKVPAFVWLENVEDEFINEEVLYYPEYNIGYILIEAENMIDFEGELFL